MQRIAFVLVPPVMSFDLAIARMVFDSAGEDRYRVLVCAAEPGPVEAVVGPPVLAPDGLAAAADADTLIVVGGGGRDDPGASVLDLVRGARGRVAAICTGVFVPAQAGLLDGHRATTHWSLAAELARRFPRVRVDPNVLYVADGPVLTSAGAAAGVELCLHIVAEDHGAAVAADAARAAVAAPTRPAGQAQVVAVPQGRDDTIAATRAWALGRLHEPLTLAALAAHAQVSTRTLTRRFHAETGQSPLQWLLRQRLERARELLETTGLPMDLVAHHCGLGSADSLRAHLVRRFGVTPSAYRASFAGR
ncbi:GlxA family transcriptional regulator [Actinomadura macrotermitis]|uniref:HTH-type transcriptional regulator CdhR n=1 Tax=Actinomadura macrotermitis TaxID=2585200 RepID=A0A7K0C3P4_9ACTN|nr:helix-turn-helix domain-containing protein [Actinomadura macrotermitis]MQY08043.1 HTH-type transcriptional regulator CdhR [Actinomadura macrotermitis]